ncbi:IS3 family transposase [Streptomyces sp. NPDC002577]
MDALEQLMPLTEHVHADSGGTYDARRITPALRRKGVAVARCTAKRLMADLGIEGVIRGRRRRTTVPEPSAPRPPDLVDRDFAGREDKRIAWLTRSRYRQKTCASGGGQALLRVPIYVPIYRVD